jgi:hypothetical protein
MAKPLTDLGMRDVEAIRRRAKRDCFEGRISQEDLAVIEDNLDAIVLVIRKNKKES